MKLKYNKAIGIIFSLTLAMIIASLAFASEAKIQGKVIDKDGNPIPGAKIILRDNSGREFVVITKEDGSYFKRGIPPGAYNFTVEKKGYKSKKFTLTLRAGAVERNDIPLVPASPEDIGGEDYTKALELFKNNEYEGAAALFEKVIKREPDLEIAYYNLGVCYLALEQYEKATTNIKRSIELYPDNINAYTNLGKIYMKLGDNEKAIEWFNKAVELKPEAIIYFDIGAVFFNSDRKEEAAQNFEKAVEIDPSFSIAYYYLGIIYFGREEFDEALKYLNKYLELEPNAPNIEEIKSIISTIKSMKDNPKE